MTTCWTLDQVKEKLGSSTGWGHNIVLLDKTVSSLMLLSING